MSRPSSSAPRRLKADSSACEFDQQSRQRLGKSVLTDSELLSPRPRCVRGCFAERVGDGVASTAMIWRPSRARSVRLARDAASAGQRSAGRCARRARARRVEQGFIPGRSTSPWQPGVAVSTTGRRPRNALLGTAPLVTVDHGHRPALSAHHRSRQQAVADLA